MTLYQINEEIMNCVDEETGEILNAEKLEQLVLERNTKLENVALWIKNLKAEEKAVKEEEDKFKKRRKAISNKMDDLKKYLFNALNNEKDKGRFKTTRVSIYPLKRESVQIDDNLDLSTLDDEYVKVSYAADKTALKEDLEQGVIIDGVNIVTNISMVVR